MFYYVLRGPRYTLKRKNFQPVSHTKPAFRALLHTSYDEVEQIAPWQLMHEREESPSSVRVQCLYPRLDRSDFSPFAVAVMALHRAQKIGRCASLTCFAIPNDRCESSRVSFVRFRPIAFEDSPIDDARRSMNLQWLKIR